jgi:calcium-dependent protein kinase
MEYCEKGDLMDKIRDREELTFSEQEASHIIGSILKALVHCNRINISHMDIKPENIMCGEDIKLIDFGLSRVLSSDDKSTVGSLYYIAPEVFKGEFNIKCDIWSLGVVLFQMLTNSYPFYGCDKDHTKELILEGKFSMKGRECKDLSS